MKADLILSKKLLMEKLLVQSKVLAVSGKRKKLKIRKAMESTLRIEMMIKGFRGRLLTVKRRWV